MLLPHLATTPLNVCRLSRLATTPLNGCRLFLPPLQGSGGECGLRGGCVEMTNIHKGAIEEIYKCASINLSPNTMGQVCMSPG